MKYFVLAGEKSGEIHGANLIKEISRKDSEAYFDFFGGDFMSEAAGKEPIVHINQLDTFGFVGVALAYRKLLGFLKLCKNHLAQNNPDAVILIDYSGFNMKVAKYAHEIGLKVHYYISPKLWVWNEKRVFKVKKYVDYMYCILPFEIDFYKKFDYEADYVGNPLIDEITSFTPNPKFLEQNKLKKQQTIALLPGSRKQEIEHILSLMGEILPEFSGYQFVIAGIKRFGEDFYKSFLPKNADIKIVYDQTYDLLQHTEAAVVTSGTATLETALFNIPEVIVYKANSLTYWIYKQLTKIKLVGLCNLIADDEVAIELIQNDFTVKNVVKELKALLKEGDRRGLFFKKNKVVIEKVGGPGASERTADLILQRIK